MQLVIRSFLIAAAAFVAVPALAQQAQVPDPVQDIALDWQASQAAQTHVLRDLQAVVIELQAARARIKELEAQLPKKTEAPAKK